MKIDRFIRVAIAVTVLVAFIVATGALLFVTESALNVWDRLSDGPAFLLYGYVAIMAAILLAAVLTIWRLVIRRKISPSRPAVPKPLSKQDIETRLRDAESAGVNVAA